MTASENLEILHILTGNFETIFQHIIASDTKLQKSKVESTSSSEKQNNKSIHRFSDNKII